jgi:hypothetical protein
MQNNKVLDLLCVVELATMQVFSPAKRGFNSNEACLMLLQTNGLWVLAVQPNLTPK